MPEAAPRKIVLCADDYGLAPGVSRGIRELLAKGRLSATGCMSVYPNFKEEGPLLRPFLEHADVGLHFTLTADKPLRSVLLAGWLRRIDPRKVRAELQRQIDIFVSAIGATPAYIDGHQHVHLLPGVREAVIETAGKLGAYVRSTHEPITRAMLRRAAPLDSAYLSWAAGPLTRLAQNGGVHTNTGFRGVRSFHEQTPFRDLFRRMIEGAADGSIVMCHPGHVDDVLRSRDPIHRQREEEFSYLASGDFPHDLAAAGLQLANLRDGLQPAASNHLPLSTAVA
ncbi:MAG TPA: ChbG/HpnK family deacetylase [Rhizomicrobium sp.]|jgi:hypothetical protein|nr:ChbG/HpnK family deacetylase [Rhizomicrobium sp.]